MNLVPTEKPIEEEDPFPFRKLFIKSLNYLLDELQQNLMNMALKRTERTSGLWHLNFM